MKLPNRYGTVYKLSGKRRNPWAVRKSIGWNYYDKETGEIVAEPTVENIKAHKYKEKRVYQYIGFYKTKQEALQALAVYNADPFAIQSDITFAEVYDKWSSRKFDETSISSIKGYKAAYKVCASIAQMRFCDIRLVHLQDVVDKSGKNYPALTRLKGLFYQLFDYAVKHEIIGKDKHIVEYVEIGKATKSDKHFRFSDSDIDVMWENKDKHEFISVILMLIYSGTRPGEIFSLKKKSVNLAEKWFYIEDGKNDNAIRQVPIHEKVFPFFEYWMNKGNSEYLITQPDGTHIDFQFRHQHYVSNYWTPLLSDMGILQYTNMRGEVKEHAPHDTRHTFTSRWKDKKLDESMRRKIQGHAGKGQGEITYTHHELEKLLAELNQF